jgi:hypothetical protein
VKHEIELILSGWGLLYVISVIWVWIRTGEWDLLEGIWVTGLEVLVVVVLFHWLDWADGL